VGKRHRAAGEAAEYRPQALRLTAAHPPTVETIQTYFAAALRLFGADRLLYGSDYPVCTTRGQTYTDTVAILRTLVAPLPDAEQRAISDDTAHRASTDCSCGQCRGRHTGLP
jgi:predicted TIM-barrel fold metal-dependent hydrolase